MEAQHCDILIVGAGPAGSSAAIAAANRGLKVLVVERRQSIGVPVRCAEYIPAPLLGEVKLGRDFVVQSVRGMKTVLPGGEIHDTRAPGFIIQRDVFDQTLAGAAGKAGAGVLAETRALTLDGSDVILRNRDRSTAKVRATVIIGADGPHSTVGRWIGSVNRNMLPALQCRFPLVRPLNHTEVYFDREIYAGYGWIFPKGREANVGIGMKHAGAGYPSMAEVFNRFISRLKKAGKIKGDPEGRTAGWIPVEPLRVTSRNQILLAGDAAGQTHPITGAGVHQAVVCGALAGESAARAVEKGNMGLLSKYDIEWRDLFGQTLSRAVKRRQSMEREWSRLEEIIPDCWVAFKNYYDND
ncbi:MAG: NAD(P)/FAD-dependent oxidoreductase [Deltaproteobacteria bacterium]|nr:NAD(P)/FAD-dependent oxidoreductase [Deltaproteobacteria bacterium]